eukprot:m.219554 g.219554  ORF g.219554 m.219554 type:complete len:109 (+) comp15915_c0_seq8:1909-2235(+)
MLFSSCVTYPHQFLLYLLLCTACFKEVYFILLYVKNSCGRSVLIKSTNGANFASVFTLSTSACVLRLVQIPITGISPPIAAQQSSRRFTRASVLSNKPSENSMYIPIL